MKTNRLLVLALAAALLPLWACEREEVTPPTGGSGSPQVEEPIIPEPEPEPDTVSLVGTVWKHDYVNSSVIYMEEHETMIFCEGDSVVEYSNIVVTSSVYNDTNTSSYWFNGHTLEGKVYGPQPAVPIYFVYDTAENVLRCTQASEDFIYYRAE